ncbi:MAG: UviB-like protein [Christensenellaceae bacterium]|jgi:septal ring factor EnvC (AmiA/AmiB activator)|nr:UviB-like protein [Christensenellaceae bacterium]
MWEEVLKIAINYGLMSALFVALLVWVLHDARQRERRYQSMLEKLHNALSVVNEIQQTTKEISKTLADITKDIAKLHKENRNVKVIKETVG